MQKNKRIILIVVSLVILIALCVIILPIIINRNNDNKFAIEDPDLITKVFIADKNNRTVLLERHGNTWTVNGSNYAFDEAVNGMLVASKRLKVRGPVSKSIYNTVITQLADNSVKVEFYARSYKINFLGINMLECEKQFNSFFVGGATMDNNGTYMIKENAKRPYVVYIPGYRGFLTPYYNSNSNVWLSHVIFSSRIPQISSITYIDNENPEESYTIKNVDSRNFIIQPKNSDTQLTQYDTVKVVDLLSAYSDIRYEAALDEDKYDFMNVDSIINTTPAHEIILVDNEGISTSLKTYRIPLTQNQKDNMPIDAEEPPYDLDRLYLWIKLPAFNLSDTENIQYKEFFALGQYFVFDDILRPLSYLK